ncbi:glutathione synthetase-like isoform X2 [Maniola hyperantus]|uniref:glutathione synthetase-like isoform X2 n=1 Tax=Aphantopus hyperantus TaxID=2795564 RepID=UPI00374A879D
MTQARLASSIPLPMEHKLLVTVIEKAKDWALMHGVGMRDKKNFTKDSIQIAPFVLIPSPFPHTEFTKSVELQPVLNELMHKVAHDDEFLTRTLENALQVDEFTANLFDIWVKVRDEGMTYRALPSMAEEKELIKRRASYKGRLTAFANYLNSLNDSLSQGQLNELQLRLESQNHGVQHFAIKFEHSHHFE